VPTGEDRRVAEQTRERPSVRPVASSAARLLAGFAALVVVGVLLGSLLPAGPAGPDAPVLAFFARHRVAALTAVLRAVTTVGSPTGLAATAVATAVVLAVLRQAPSALVLLAVGVPGVELLSTTVKSLVRRPRPPLGSAVGQVSAHGYSFPSGHAIQSAAVYGLLASLLVVRTRRRLLRAATWTAAGLATVAVGLSRVYLGVHWPTDVLGGWLLGAGWLAVLLLTIAPRPPAALPREGAQ
jgi:undecaprenyl-diphosphatase